MYIIEIIVKGQLRYHSTNNGTAKIVRNARDATQFDSQNEAENILAFYECASYVESGCVHFVGDLPK